MAHIGLIARASGPAGEIARTVKRLDLADRLLFPNRRADGWHPPYRAALALLEEVEAGRAATSPRPRVASSSGTWDIRTSPEATIPS